MAITGVLFDFSGTLEHRPVDRRPDGLRPVLSLLDKAGEQDERSARVS